MASMLSRANGLMASVIRTASRLYPTLSAKSSAISYGNPESDLVKSKTDASRYGNLCWI